ncbi:hypothetical protein GQ53DRAFT_816628 [Thozetella sp. PMI_491]|nr:hypothetical protein GQ53DRAFT_816628 [Thozetella sp. PMI_491]
MASLRQTSILAYFCRRIKFQHGDDCLSSASSSRRIDSRRHDDVESSVQTARPSPELIKKALREDTKAFEHMDNSIFKSLFGKTKQQFRKGFPKGRKRYITILRDCKLRPGKAIYDHRRYQLRKLKNRRKGWKSPGQTPLQQSWAVGNQDALPESSRSIRTSTLAQ